MTVTSDVFLDLRPYKCQIAMLLQRGFYPLKAAQQASYVYHRTSSSHIGWSVLEQEAISWVVRWLLSH